MSIRLEALSLLVPVRLIEARYPGGLQACIDDHEALLGVHVWFDARLWCHAAATPGEMRALVDGWRVVGLEPLVREGGAWRWNEVCVVDAALHAPTLPCSWIESDPATGLACLRGADPGHPVGATDFPAPPDVRARAARRPGLAALSSRISGRSLPGWLRHAVMRG
jgi:hypothetical protein